MPRVPYTNGCYPAVYEKGRVEVWQVCVQRFGKIGVRCRFAIRGRQKVVCADIHTTSGFRNTSQRIRHFANDKAIPATRRLFQRDLFRVSDERTVLTDFDFTKFRNFQSVQPRACSTDRILTDTFTCLEFVFSQIPRHRSDRTLKLWGTFLFRFRVFASAKEVLMRSVDAFDGRHLHILRMFRIVPVGFTKFRKVIDLVIHRHRNTTILPHLRTHLKHIVIQLFLVLQLIKQPAFLSNHRVCPIFKGSFHRLSRITSLTLV